MGEGGDSASGESADAATAAERDGLNEIARRRAWLFGWFIAGVPAAALGLVLPGPLFPILVGILFGGWIVVLARHQFARCPRCHGFFNWTVFAGNPITQKCMRCGLALRARDRPSGL